jgi:hypothetical protein
MSKLSHRGSRKIRQEAAFDHGSPSNALKVCTMMFHFAPNLE